MKRLIAFGSGLLVFAFFSFAKGPKERQQPGDANPQKRWVDSVFNTLNKQQKLGQLFLITAQANKNSKQLAEIKDLVSKYAPGGILWKQKSPVQLGKLANYYQTVSKTPLLYALDGGLSLSASVDSTTRYPGEMALAAIQNDSLINAAGTQFAKEYKRLGIHLVFTNRLSAIEKPLLKYTERLQKERLLLSTYARLSANDSIADFYRKTITPGSAAGGELKDAYTNLFIVVDNLPKAIKDMERAVSTGLISQDELDARCRKILEAKYRCGLNRKQEIVTRNLTKELNSKQSVKLAESLANAALTLLKNEYGFLPLKRTDSLRIVEISVGPDEPKTVYNSLKNFGFVEHIGLGTECKPEALIMALSKTRESDLVILQLKSNIKNSENQFSITGHCLKFIDSVAEVKPIILLVAAQPSVLNELLSATKFRAIIMAYENTPVMLKATAGLIPGIIKPGAKLPIKAGNYNAGAGLSFELVSVAEQNLENKNFYKKKFGAIDSIALAGIEGKAYPGCQIVALKDGEVIYQKSFGNFTYNKNSKQVDNGTIYDLASVTKIAASSLALMKLKTENKFDYKKTLGSYLPELSGSNKENLVIEEVLAHQAGLQAWIPYYANTLGKGGKYKPGFYSNQLSEEFPTQVAKDLYVVKGFRDSVYYALIRSKLDKPGKYVYSDLGYYFMQQIIEQQTQTKLNVYVSNLYRQVGIGLTYHPLTYFSKTQVAPTENDLKFRKQVVQGYVHDPGAALLGGVAGHAGLFGNALDLAKLMQLFLNGGELNGVRLLDSNVVKDFTSCHFCPQNRRGLCFEKPEMDSKKDSPVTSECSAESFGHSGFTGTFAWADPKNKLVVVFLSNRVYPDAEENRLTKMGIRGKIHKAFYDAVK